MKLKTERHKKFVLDWKKYCTKIECLTKSLRYVNNTLIIVRVSIHAETKNEVDEDKKDISSW